MVLQVSLFASVRIHDICCESGYGFADPCLRLMDPDPAIFIIDLQDANKKPIKNFFLHIAF
jgi:hypothetical protein